MPTENRIRVLEDEPEESEAEGDRGLGTLPSRRRARALSLQVLYEVDASGHDPEDVLARAKAEAHTSAREEAFARELVMRVLGHRVVLDAQIQRFAPAWPVRQLPVIDRNLLRLAIYEITTATGTPPKVAINEAVELAKLFGSESSPRFVNGVLGALMQTLPEGLAKNPVS